MVPGHILEETMQAMRSQDGQKSFFLHCDSGIGFVDVLGEAAPIVIEKVNGEFFDAKYAYMVAAPRAIFDGVGDVQPLYRYARQEGCPAIDVCKPIKDLILRTCM